MRFRSVAVLAAASLFAACSSSTPAPQTPEPQIDGVSADPQPIRVGETATGTIEESDPVWGGHGRFDLYTFEANEGDLVLIELSSLDFDPYLVVGAESGGIFDAIAQDDDSGGELDARIRFSAPRSGRFRILAQAYADYGLGSYTLSVQPYVIVPVESTPLEIGAAVAGTLTDEDAYDDLNGSHYDEYTFQARAGERYAVAMGSDDFDAYLVLGTGSGELFEEITRNDDAGDSYDSRIVFAPDEDGTYTVHATSYDGMSAGAYTIEVSALAPPGPMVVSPLRLGETLNGSLDESDQVDSDGSYFDVYSFTGQEGDRVEIGMRSDEVDSYLELGEPVAAGDEFWAEFSDDDSGGGVNSRIVVTLWRDGEYQVRAYSLYPGEAGSYTIRLVEPRSGPELLQEIELGQTINGSLDDTAPVLDDGSYYDIFTFEGRAGQRIRVRMSSDDFDSFLQFGPWRDGEIDITDSDDDSGGGDSGLDSMLELTLPDTGTYAIMVNTVFPNEVGLYTVTLEER